MRRILSMFLILALLLSGGALAAGINANLGRNVQQDYRDYISGGAVCGESIYLLGDQNIYVWKSGDGDVRPLTYQIDQEENKYARLSRIFSDGERLLGLLATQNYGGDYSLEKLELVELLPSDGEMSISPLIEVDTSELTVNYGGGDQLAQINDACCSGGYVCLQLYGPSGYPCVYCLDMASGAGFYVELGGNELTTVVPYEDGCFLIQEADYQNSQLRLYSFDPESESTTELSGSGMLSLENSLCGLAYSAESGRIFYQSGGYLYAVENFDFENAQPVAELSLEYGDSRGGMLLPGDVYVFCGWNVTAVRSTHADELPSRRIVVQDDVYLEAVMDAYYSFGNSHGDTAVVVSRDYMQDSRIIEAMMNRDSSVDIYVMGVQSQAYDALFSRGYMLDLSGSEAVRSAVEGMYPGIRSAISRDGEIYALPVNVYGWSMGLSSDALEKLGLSIKDIPSDWPGFLDFLSELPDLLPEDGSVKAFESHMTQEDVRYNLYSGIMEAYQLWLNEVGLERGYDTPELRAMLEKLMAIDFAAFGLPEDYEESEDGVGYFVYETGDSITLFNTGVGCTIGNFYYDNTPLLLSVSPEYAAPLPLEVHAAFVNPFSENVEQALEFLAEIYANVDSSTLYNLSDALNEPLRSEYYEESMQSLNERIAELEAQLESVEAVDAPLIEENLYYMRKALEEDDKYWWEASPDSIAWYRSRGDSIAVKRYNYLYGDQSGEIWELTSQFMSGMIDLDSYLKSIDKKATMMAMEGN